MTSLDLWISEGTVFFTIDNSISFIQTSVIPIEIRLYLFWENNDTVSLDTIGESCYNILVLHLYISDTFTLTDTMCCFSQNILLEMKNNIFDLHLCHQDTNSIVIIDVILVKWSNTKHYK
jgi:hypothetical protein